VEAHAALRRLGPDFLAEDYDEDVALANLRARPGDEIAVALLDQSVVAGVGNVYKSEVLFLNGVDPFARVGSLDADALRAILRTAHVEMRRNMALGGERRTNHTLGSGPLWVYGRDGKPCLKCGTPICRALQGEQRRSTYWCPTCQPPVQGAQPRWP
jgi:endonuclease VIII